METMWIMSLWTEISILNQQDPVYGNHVNHVFVDTISTISN